MCGFFLCDINSFDITLIAIETTFTRWQYTVYKKHKN